MSKVVLINSNKIISFSILFSIIITTLSCGGVKNEKNIEEATFPFFEFLDNTVNFKGQTLKSEFIYNGDVNENSIKLGLSELLANSEKGISIKCYKYGGQVASDGRLDVILFIPKDVKVPNAHYLDEITIEFTCEEGKTNSGNKVISIIRPIKE